MDSGGKRAERALNKATELLRRSEVAFSKGRWDAVVYAAHMAAEQALTALQEFTTSLAKLGGTPLPSEGLKMRLRGIEEACQELAEERARVTHRLPGEDDVEDFAGVAPRALERAEEIVAVCREEVSRLLASGRTRKASKDEAVSRDSGVDVP